MSDDLQSGLPTPAAALRLTLHAGDCLLHGSPCGSPAKGQLRSALKAPAAARRMQFAAEPQVQLCEGGSISGSGVDDEEEEGGCGREAAPESSQGGRQASAQAPPPASATAPRQCSPPPLHQHQHVQCAPAAADAFLQPQLYSTMTWPAQAGWSQPPSPAQSPTIYGGGYQPFGMPAAAACCPASQQQHEQIVCQQQCQMWQAQAQQQAQQAQQQQRQRQQAEHAQQQPPRAPSPSPQQQPEQPLLVCLGADPQQQPAMLRPTEVRAGIVSIRVSSPRVQVSGLAGRGPQQAPTPARARATAAAQTQTDAEPAEQQAAAHPPQQQQQQAGRLASLPPDIPAEPAEQIEGPAQQQQMPGRPGAQPAQEPQPRAPRVTAAGTSRAASHSHTGCRGRLQAQESSEGQEVATGGSLSSGLSPQDGQPRLSDWDQEDALQALAAGADSFGRAAAGFQHPQRSGRARRLSTADALPSRLAAQQLGSLAGLSRKAQEAILRSQRLFERQAEVVERATVARIFYAWRHLHMQHQHRVQLALAACHRAALGRLRQCLHAWRQLCGRHEALARARVLLRRRLLLRCWQEWRRVCGLRWWKLQLELAAQVRRLESRPVRLMQRYRLRALLAAWRREARYRAAKKALWAAALRQARRAAACAAFGGWQAVAAELAARRRALQRAERALGRLRLRQAFSAWASVGQEAAARRAQKAAAQQHCAHVLARRAFRGWRYVVWFTRTAREASSRQRAKQAAAAFASWRHWAELAAARRELLAGLAAARAGRRLASAFEGWMGVVEGWQQRRREEELDRLAEQAERLAAENAQLRSDSERLCRVIDSGSWSQQRVDELLQAGRVLQEERDALARLLASLQQRQPGGSGAAAALQDATNSPGAAVHSLGSGKGRLAEHYSISPSGGIQLASPAQESGSRIPRPPLAPPSRPASPGPDAAARNRMLVRNGSSFNALVRALKQDLVASGGLQRAGPAAVLEVDKLSLARLSVAVDNGMEVEAVGSPDRRGVAFGRSYPPSPPKQRPGSGACTAGQLEGSRLGSGFPAAADAARRSGSSSRSGLLEAALRLQGIGGRSAGLCKGGGAGG